MPFTAQLVQTYRRLEADTFDASGRLVDASWPPCGSPGRRNSSPRSPWSAPAGVAEEPEPGTI
jgi:hypothetical protein